MSKLKQGDRVVTTKNLFVVGHSEDTLEAGAEGFVIGPTTQEGYLTVKLDVVELPTYIREANLEVADTEPLEDLSFNDNEMTVEYWEGDKLNAPWVRFYVKTYETKYDQDYDEEHGIIGDYIMRRDEMILLRDFLTKAIDKSKDWKRKGRKPS